MKLLQTSVPVTIVDVHADNKGEPYYTIQFATGSTIQTIHQHLQYYLSNSESTPVRAPRFCHVNLDVNTLPPTSKRLQSKQIAFYQ